MDIFLDESLPPKPPVDTMSMAGMAIDYKCDDEKKNS
jgi:hypothetical protein